jgi:hypothetical protein
MLPEDTKRQLLDHQCNEITEHHFYISVAMDQPFKKRFAEMAALSLVTAGLSFLLGLVLRVLLGVEV